MVKLDKKEGRSFRFMNQQHGSCSCSSHPSDGVWGFVPNWCSGRLCKCDQTALTHLRPYKENRNETVEGESHFSTLGENSWVKGNK